MSCRYIICARESYPLYVYHWKARLSTSSKDIWRDWNSSRYWLQCSRALCISRSIAHAKDYCLTCARVICKNVWILFYYHPSYAYPSPNASANRSHFQCYIAWHRSSYSDTRAELFYSWWFPIYWHFQSHICRMILECGHWIVPFLLSPCDAHATDTT